MRRMTFILAAFIAAGTAAASDKTDVMATVNQFMDGFNKGDTKTALAACAAQTSIIDEFPPYAWQACSDWANDFDADSKKNGITNGVVKLGKPKHLDVTGDRAYVVLPADYNFKKNGKPAAETGSTFTVALQKVAAGWRITGWTWSKH
jgi:ketosteroid isomerase-like protein